jgi:hypothetical protein
MSPYQTDMTVNDLIAHLTKAAQAGYGDKPLTIEVFAVADTVDLDRRPNFPRAESAGVGRVSHDQRTGSRLQVVAETW